MMIDNRHRSHVSTSTRCALPELFRKCSEFVLGHFGSWNVSCTFEISMIVFMIVSFFSLIVMPISVVNVSPQSLALPYAFYQAGFVFGSLLLLVSAWATSASIALLVKACDEYRLPTYEKIVERTLGKQMRMIVEVSILVFCCGTGTSVRTTSLIQITCFFVFFSCHELSQLCLSYRV